MPRSLVHSITNPLRWADYAKKHNVKDTSIFNLEDYNSGSKIEEPQYLSLRAYWSIVDADFFEPDKWGIRDVDTAGGELKKLPHWDEFMNQVGFRGPIETILPIDPKLGVFSNTWYQIQQIRSSKPSADQESNVDFSPAVTRLRSRLDKQSKVASDIFTGSPAHSPTRLTRRLQEISLGRPEQEQVGEASADNATWDFDNTSSPPDDIKKDPTFKFQETFLPVSDETLVNAFIISLAAAVTFSTPGVKALWSLERKGYTVGIDNDTKIFTARTDGHLSLPHLTYSKIIVEVKGMTRESSARIRMQEVAEMAAWIHAEPDIIPEGMRNVPLRDIWYVFFLFLFLDIYIAKSPKLLVHAGWLTEICIGSDT